MLRNQRESGVSVSASVVVYRTPVAKLAPLYDSFKKCRMPVSVDIVDNGNDPELAAWCARIGWNYLNSGGNIGFGAAHNISLQRNLDRSAYHAVVNPDIEFGAGVFEILADFMESHGDVGQVMPRIVYPDGATQYVAKLLPNPVVLFARRFFPGPLKGVFAGLQFRYEMDHVQPASFFDAPSLSGCFMFLRVADLKRAGLFDPRYFMYMEDVDLTRRIGRRARTVCLPEVTVVHGFEKGSYKNRKLLSYHIQSAVRYFNKWGWAFDAERWRVNKATMRSLHRNGPVKVLHVYKTFFPDSYGGVEQSIYEMCQGTVDLGGHAEVFVLSRQVRRVERSSYRGIEVTRVPADFELSSTPFSFRAIFTLHRLQRRFDIIHLHFPYPFMDVLYLLSCGGKPMVITYHSDIVKQRLLNYVYTPIRKLLFSRCGLIAPTSPNYLRSSLVLRRYSQRSLPIPLGLEQSRYPAPSPVKVAENRAKWGQRYFCFIGVFRYYKGLRYLIEAAAQVDANIVLIGDGPESGELKKQARAGNLSNIIFAGAVDDQTKMDILAGAYCFVFPSQYRSEAYGLGLVEAAMLGKPMISCEIGTGTSYINLDGQTGTVVPPFRPVALAHAMNRMLEDPERAAGLGRNARARYELNFTAKLMVGAYMAVYHRLLAGKKGAALHA
jgi:rhamnosyl/mannosyltransferase